MAESVAGVIISVFCYRRMMTPGADVLWTCFYRMAVPMTCWAFACGIRLPKVRPWMRQSMFLYAIHFVVVRFVRCGTSDRSCFRNAGSRRNCAVYLFSASGDRCLCILRAGEIPCKVCTGSVENLVGWKEAGRMSVGRESVYAGQNHTSKNYMLIFGKNANSFFIGNPLYYL